MTETTPENRSVAWDQTQSGSAMPPQMTSANSDGHGSPNESPVQKKMNLRRLFALILVVAIGVGGYFFVSHRGIGVSSLDKIQGTVALSEQDLRAVIAANHLTVYWAGPMVGAKYSLNATNPGIVYLKYLPGGVGINDSSTPFRTVGTYVKKSAYQVGLYTGTTAGNVGTTDPNGNSVFYASARDTNVYIGLKGRDIQLEVFDPVRGVAIGLVQTPGQIRQIS